MWCATDNWRAVLAYVRDNVAHEVEKSTNYTCVETVDRTVFISSHDLLPGCAYESTMPERTKAVQDRLRLDIAVSEGKEIFAWHGQNSFSGSSTIDDVVQRGTVSSGEFIGFLSNIFVHGGIQFEYTGEALTNGIPTYSFNYVVPISSSGYHVGARHGKPAVPFHGSFSVRGPDCQLLSLKIIADKLPESSMICSAETEMEYQIAKISGRDALIPSLFILRLDDTNHRYTVSRSTYSQCHEFTAESTLQFDTSAANEAGGSGERVEDEHLPRGTLLRIALKTPIDDESSDMGDPVEGVLLRAVKVREGGLIPKNTAVKGVITLLEDFDEPKHYYLVRAEFNRIELGRKRFVFRATPVVSKLEASKLNEIYGGPWPADIQDAYNEGVFVFRSRHIHLDQRFGAGWVAQPAVGGPGAR